MTLKFESFDEVVQFLKEMGYKVEKKTEEDYQKELNEAIEKMKKENCNEKDCCKKTKKYPFDGDKIPPYINPFTPYYPTYPYTPPITVYSSDKTSEIPDIKGYSGIQTGCNGCKN